MAMVIMGANIAGIYGAQIFRSDDKPRYRRAFVIGIAVLAFGTVLAVVRKVDGVVIGKKAKQDDDASEEVYEDLKGKGPALSSDLQPQPMMIEKDSKPVLSLTTR